MWFFYFALSNRKKIIKELGKILTKLEEWVFSIGGIGTASKFTCTRSQHKP